MASGKTHLIAEAGVGVALIAAWSRPEVREAVGDRLGISTMASLAAGYVFAMIWLSPDLDLDKCDALRRWGPLRFLWRGYPRLFAHRGLSHDLLLGAITRLVYLAVVLGLFTLPFLAAAVGAGWVDPKGFEPDSLAPIFPWIAAFVVGCYIPNTIHVLIDRLTPA